MDPQGACTDRRAAFAGRQVIRDVVRRTSGGSDDWPMRNEPAEDRRLVAILDRFDKPGRITFLNRRQGCPRMVHWRPRAGSSNLCGQLEAADLACAAAMSCPNFSAVIASSRPFLSLPNAISGTPILVWPVSTTA